MAKGKNPTAPLVLRKKQGPSLEEIHGDGENERTFQERLDLREAAKAQYRPFLDKLQALWAPHEKASLPLHHQSGILISEQIKELKNDPEQVRALQSAIADDLGRNRSDVSRELAFVTRWPTFEEFQNNETNVKTWSQLKNRLAELSRAERKTGNGTGKPKRSTDKQREALVEKFQLLGDAIEEVKDDFSVKQLATVETITEGILNKIGELAAPLKKSPKPHGD